MQQALHFGAGNIGRGFIGKLLVDAGFKLTFVDVDERIIDAMNRQQSYRVRIVNEHLQEEEVANISALNSYHPKVLECIATADVITTAVGPQILLRIAETIARGLIKRCDEGNCKPLNIIACENSVRSTTQLKQHVLAQLPEQYQSWVAQHIGFVDSAVDRIVPPSITTSTDPLTVTVEAFSEWITDRDQFVGDPPTIAGMELTDNLIAFVERKLFTLNTGHAITAWLGRLANYSTIRDAILDTEIRSVVQGAMTESGAVLVRRHGFNEQHHAAYIKKILQRFENPWLNDDVSRVGRQPIRKLGGDDRLFKPISGTLAYQLPNDNLIMGVAAALHYRNDQDEEAVKLANLIETLGPEATLAQISGFRLDSDVITRATDRWRELK